jgi:Rps23 Pro-64 3,4-dihydroxylase Tpa1-like proline 4-hydroxylase
MNLINPEILTDEATSKLHAEFDSALPYRHVVIENLLKTEIANQLFENFPTVEKLDVHYHGLNEKKSEGANFESFHPLFSELKKEMMSKEWSDWVSKVTGIKDVFITDDNLGMGLHQGTNGSFLDVHVDFNIHHVKNVHRRLNMLIYLNKNWKDEYNGAIEMWNADMSKLEKAVMPNFNRCLIFETSEISYHGYTTPLNIPENESRKSIYSYYYTNQREGAAKYHDTVFKARPDDSAAKKVKTEVKETAKNFIKRQLKNLGIKY